MIVTENQRAPFPRLIGKVRNTRSHTSELVFTTQSNIATSFISFSNKTRNEAGFSGEGKLPKAQYRTKYSAALIKGWIIESNASSPWPVMSYLFIFVDLVNINCLTALQLSNELEKAISFI